MPHSISFLQNIRLGLVHVAVAITFIPINGVLNRIMIHEMGILASIVAGLVIFPYLLSPMQMFIGQFSDKHPVFGYRRTPYIVVGVSLCIVGLLIAPRAAFLMGEQFWQGLGLGVVAFGLWGIGYNLAAVSYLSLASDMAGPKQRSRVISVMWFMMIVSIIITATTVGHALEPYSNAMLLRVFGYVALASGILMVIGLAGVEPRIRRDATTAGEPEERVSNRDALSAVFGNPQTRRFFFYLILLLAAIIGQDILLEPYGAQAFGMTVKETTRLTAVWGTSTMVALLLQGLVLSKWITNRQGAVAGGLLAASGLTLVAVSGMFHLWWLFRPGIAVLGFGTGLATSTNLALMLGMTTPERTGLFIGAWGVADAMSRGLGNLLGGVGRDLLSLVSGSATTGYAGVFLLEALMLAIALLLLRTIDVSGVHDEAHSFTDVIALSGEAA